jgi:hypothetical protein
MHESKPVTRCCSLAPIAVAVVAAGFVFFSVQLPLKSMAEPAEQAAQSTRERVIPENLGEHSKEDYALTLTDLRDTGLALQQIKQQAINIYQEATRTRVPESADAHITDLDAISHKDLESGESQFLTTRPDWLVFYVGTMEPTIHLCLQDVKDTQKGAYKMLVPKGTKDEFHNMFNQWAEGIDGINEHLTRINELIGEKNNNISIAREAVNIFDIAEKLETTRRHAFNLLKKEQGTGELEAVDVSKD